MKKYSQIKAMLSVTQASLRSIFRSPAAVVFSLVFPLIFIIVFGFIGNGNISVSVGVHPMCDTSNQIYEVMKGRPEMQEDIFQVGFLHFFFSFKTTTLINQPKIIFLDEPTTGLDPQARRNLWDLIRGIREKGTTIVLTTHYMDEAEELCDRVGVMEQGKIISLDTPGKLIDNLVASGFERKKEVKKANLEDVFLHLTGHEWKNE